MPLVLPDGYEYVAGSMISATWLIVWQILRIYPAREAAGIYYPQLYAESAQLKDNPAALRYNCVQRCHQNTLEYIPLICISTLVTGLKYPYIAAAASFFWVLTRVAYTIGYSSGVPEKRAAGNAGGFIVLMGLLATAAFTAAQLCFF
ncbi:membrane-associated proteins in eicosanoid and glutathione metabolism [Rhizopogon salebrosus TDB-379]|nr:membrane-associated proteins in eicosanoid and glutathione metabolism [Rhizopogon salebrosus TDB-379]